MGVTRNDFIRGADGTTPELRVNRQGSLVSIENYFQWAIEGRIFFVNGGTGTTVITFAGAYDADAPDLHVHVPSGTTIIPLQIVVKYEAIGTESELEVIALASNTGDSSATGTAATIYNARVDQPRASLCTATVAVDAAGITDPNAGNRYEFWRAGHPLKDTAATGENDRHEQVYIWSAVRNGPPPVIVGASSGSALAVYAASQAGTGFIIASWAEFVTSDLT